MQKKKLLMLLSSFCLLSGCAAMHREGVKQDQEYLKQSNTIPATRMPTTSSTDMQSYYPIPPVNNTNAPVQPANTVPPGSQLPMQSQVAPLTPVAAAPAKPAAPATAVIASSNTAIVLNMPYNQAWDRVGQGLRASGYKVMQQDKSMGAYYILDLAGSGGVLKTDTPIYRINVKGTGTTTNVSLVDGQNNPASPAVSGRILTALKQKM